MVKHFLLIMVSAIFLQSALFAQTTSPGNPATVYPVLKAKKYKILFITRKPLVASSLDSLVGNTLYITRKRGSQPVSVEVISGLSVARKMRPVLRGMAFGAITGAAVGAVFGLAARGPSDSNNFVLEPEIAASAGATAGLLLGILTGTILGATSYRYTNYDLTALPPPEKATSIAGILSGQ